MLVNMYDVTTDLTQIDVEYTGNLFACVNTSNMT